MFSYVYVHFRLSNGSPFYVGKGSSKYRHKSRCSRNAYWHNVVNKEGGFKAEKIIDGIDDDLAYLCEIEAIELFKRRGFKLVNMTDGGEGHLGLKARLGVVVDWQTKEKLRQINLGHKQSQETIAKRIATFKKIGYKPKTRKGKENGQYKGGYVTPAGVFDTLDECAENNNCTVKKVRMNLYGCSMMVKGKRYSYPPKDGWKLLRNEHGHS